MLYTGKIGQISCYNRDNRCCYRSEANDNLAVSGFVVCVKYIFIHIEGKHMWKFWKKPEKPKTKIDTLAQKVDQSVAATEKDLKGLSKRSKRDKSTEDVIVHLKGDLENIEKKK